METILRVYDTYDITCTKKTWASTVDITDVNVFSGVNPTTLEEIDIKDYLVDMGDLSYDFDEAEKENGENQLFYVSSDITFKLTGIENSDFLKTYFGLYSNTDYIKWHVKLILDGFTVWEGLINHESISLDQSPSKDSDIISVTALSFEKEFKQYFQAIPIPSTGIFSLIGGQNALSKPINGLINPGYGGAGYQRQGTNIRVALNNIFDGTSWSLEQGLGDWYIIDNPVLAPKSSAYGTSDNYVFVKSSVERIRANGDNCYDFLRRVCNSMGWVFYYYGGQFIIKNRATDLPTETILDVSDIQENVVSKYKETEIFEHILLLDGAIDGGDGTGGNIGGDSEAQQPYQMRGARMQIISDRNPDGIRIGTWWQNMTGFLLNIFNIGDTFLRYFNETSDTFNLAFHKKTAVNTWELTKRGVSQQDMLRIDCGDTGNLMWLYDVTNGDNAAHSADSATPAPASQWTNNRVRFRGNYGNCLVKLTNLGGWKITYTYQDYVKTSLFYDNFKKFFSSKTTRKINVKYDGVITNPIQVFRFSGDDTQKYDGVWVINSMKINILDETTDFELQRKSE